MSAMSTQTNNAERPQEKKMDREIFITICRAAYGENFATPISRELNVTDRSVRRWVSGQYAIPDIGDELIQILERRAREIEDACRLARL